LGIRQSSPEASVSQAAISLAESMALVDTESLKPEGSQNPRFHASGLIRPKLKPARFSKGGCCQERPSEVDEQDEQASLA
jgi:hypothetical protein